MLLLYNEKLEVYVPTEYVVQIKRRIELNDAHAFFHLRLLYSNGDSLANIPKDKVKAEGFATRFDEGYISSRTCV